MQIDIQQFADDNLLRAAQAYLIQGIPLFPHRNHGAPHGLSPGQAAHSCSTIGRADKWFGPEGKFKDLYLGIPCGTVSGMVVLDVDIKGEINGYEILKELLGGQEPEEALAHVPMQRSPSGGYHYFFACPDNGFVTSKGNVAHNDHPGLDYLGTGQYVRVWPTPGCEWHQGGELPPLPDFMLPPAKMNPSTELGRGNENVTDDDLLQAHPVRRAFNEICDIDELLQAHGYKRHRENKSMITYISPLSESKQAGVRFFKEQGVVYSHHGNDLLEPERGHDGFALWAALERDTPIYKLAESGIRDALFKEVENLAGVEEAVADAPLIHRLILDKNGKPLPNFMNLAVVTRSPEMEKFIGQPRFNEFEDKRYLGETPMRDEHVADMREWTNGLLRQQWGKEDTFDALSMVGRENAYDPLKTYIDSLESTSETLDEFFKLMKFNELDKVIFRRWMIQGVVRALKAPIQCDLMLILVGRQGLGKSRFLKALVPDESWFTDSITSAITAGYGQTKELEKLRGKWIIEMPELVAFRRSSLAVSVADELKQFLSVQTDTYRPAYGRITVNYNRRCIFAGTSNDRSFLNDPTGSRRFGIIEVKPPEHIDWVQWVIDNRDGMWAGAKQAYEYGEEWYIADDLMAEMQERNKSYDAKDIWGDTVTEWAEDKTNFKTADVIIQALSLDMGRVNNSHQTRIGHILRTAGFINKPRMIEKKLHRVWINPDSKVDSLGRKFLYNSQLANPEF